MIAEDRALADAVQPFTPEEVPHVLSVCDAGWMHSGDPKDQHDELTDKA